MQIFKTALQGLGRAETKLDATAKRIAGMPLSAEQPADTVDLSRDMIDLMTARNDTTANVRAAQTGDEMTRTLLDLVK